MILKWSWVRDNGIGIDPLYKDKIFGLFKRLHHGHKYGGTGIGLTICQRIVERYGGRICVESQPGPGIHFPLHGPAARRIGKEPDASICCWLRTIFRMR